MLVRLLIGIDHSNPTDDENWDVLALSFGLRSGSGKWSEGGEQRSRSATPRADPQTEANSCGERQRMSLVASARFYEAERAWSIGGKGRPVARGPEQNERWSRRDLHRVTVREILGGPAGLRCEPDPCGLSLDNQRTGCSAK